MSSGEEHQDDIVRVSADAARSYATTLLKAYGVAEDNAAHIASCLVEADLRGVDTHGINRLPSYMARVRAGVLDATATPTVHDVTPACAHVDGRNGFGFLAAAAGMDRAAAMARDYGVGLCAVRHSNHFGMSAWVVQRAVERHGVLALVFTNSSPAMPAWGGRAPLLGVSPIACGAPGGEGQRPFVLDMAPSVAARGKVYKALRRGEEIPEGWALDAGGAPTRDPARALEGTMLPMGGPKGSGLAIMMDVFTGVFSGAAFAGGVTNPYDPSKPADVGHFIVAVKPDLFMSLDEFKERMKYLYEQVVESPKMQGVDRIYFPGELEQLREEERSQNGIPFKKSEIDTLNKEAERVGAEKITYG